MDLDLFRTHGRAARPIVATVVRALDETDLALLQDEKGAEPTALKRLSDRHHALARNLANGMAPGEAALVSGYVSSRVSILQDDPAFKELVEFYRRSEVLPAYREFNIIAAGLSVDVLTEIADRVETEPEKVSMGQLLEIAKVTADRTGHGPQTNALNVNVNVDLAGRLQRARERVAARQIEGEIL